MKVVCAWCNEKMGQKPPYDDMRTTHGICPKCLKALNLKKGGKKGEHRGKH